MALIKWHRGARFALSLDVLPRLLVGLTVAALGYFAITPTAVGPIAEHTPAPAQSIVSQSFASLSYHGVDPVITGSISNIFRSSGFVGPNRLEKTNRLQARLDVAEMAQTFSEARIRLAALNVGPTDPSIQQSLIGAPIINQSAVEVGPAISIAVIDPALASAALQAIATATLLDPSIPRPTVIPQQLAYARENTPTTERQVSHYSERERWCLSTAIYFEARGEAYRGQVGVAQVILNRVAHSVYPNTICGVVFQNQSWRNRCQFSFACDGIPERVNDQASWDTAEEITRKVTNGTLYLADVADATHYHANYVYPHWAPRMTRLARIGAHIFYRFRRG